MFIKGAQGFPRSEQIYAKTASVPYVVVKGPGSKR